jgi:hypothetical protein
MAIHFPWPTKKSYAQKFVELGGNIVAEVTVNKGDTDMLPVLEAITATEAQLVFLTLFPPEGAARCSRPDRSRGWKPA